MIVTVFAGAVGFMFATTQPLTEVAILALENVLASEQEVILDMLVTASNRNIVVVTVDTSNLDVFAKSKYAGTDSEWWKDPSGPPLEDGVRERDVEAIGDAFCGIDCLRIGNVLELNSPLMFEGSPFHHEHSISMGQVRITEPGNITIPSGRERWERIVQHEFDLIIRGTLKYTLPLTQRVRTATVDGRVTVKPNAAIRKPDSYRPVPDLTDGNVHITG
jgi:hypothetical protein